MPTNPSSNFRNRPSDQYGPFQILSLDGGGFRGLFAARCLALWEEQSGRRAADCFDLISGTSTGAILALGLSLGIPARQLVDFYLVDGRAIFPTSRIARAYRACRRWIRPEFPSATLSAALRKRLGEHSRLGDCRTRVIVPAYDLSTRRPYLFKTDHHPDYKYDWTRPAWEVAMASTAAPTYFPCYRSSWKSIYVDGGVWANNPSYIGHFEATEVLGVPSPNVRILNLGTGVPRQGNGDLSWKERLGIVGWAAQITDVVLDANALATGGVLDRICGENYVRVTPSIGHEQMPLDRYRPEQLLALAEERARFFAGAAEAFFQHGAAPYPKHRATQISMEAIT